jgi:hypothetical protein
VYRLPSVLLVVLMVVARLSPMTVSSPFPRPLSLRCGVILARRTGEDWPVLPHAENHLIMRSVLTSSGDLVVSHPTSAKLPPLNYPCCYSAGHSSILSPFGVRGFSQKWKMGFWGRLAIRRWAPEGYGVDLT